MKIVRRYIRNTHAAAGVEFALWLSVLLLPILNVVDTGFYIYQRMQLENAAQAAAQAAWALCDTSAKLPVASNCANLQTTLATAAHSTSLGTNAVLQTSAEGYYCTNTSGTLQLGGTAGVINTSGSNTPPVKPSPFNCTYAGGASSTLPGDYVLITVNATYASLFNGLSITSIFPSPITKTAWIRLS